MEINLPGLQDFLNKSTIPVYKKSPKTFLQIARQPHYENVISNIYAFFFDVNEEHGMNDLFIQSFIQCITEIRPDKNLVDLIDFDVQTEYSTLKNGRIDILLSNERAAIIIENKVYHHLNNNLEDYWNTIISGNLDTMNTVGVVLSLREIGYTGHSDFVSISHIRFLDKVMSNIGAYIINANEKYLTFLKDLYQNIQNMSKKSMNEKDVSFYFQNCEKINQLVKFRDSVSVHIREEILKTQNLLEGFKYRRPNAKSINFHRLRYLDFSENSNIMFTILFEKLLIDERNMLLLLEIQGNELKRLKEVYQQVHLDEKERMIFNPNFLNQNGYAHFALKEYHLTDLEIFDLSNTLVEILERDGFLSLLHKVNDVLTEK